MYIKHGISSPLPALPDYQLYKLHLRDYAVTRNVAVFFWRHNYDESMLKVKSFIS